MLLSCQMLYDESIGLTESATARAKVWLRKKTMDICACESEEHEHARGGYWCECYSAVRYTIVNRSRRICRKDKGLVPKRDHGPVCMQERGTIIMSDVLY
jgi:hypothetical protein